MTWSGSCHCYLYPPMIFFFCLIMFYLLCHTVDSKCFRSEIFLLYILVKYFITHSIQTVTIHTGFRVARLLIIVKTNHQPDIFEAAPTNASVPLGQGLARQNSKKVVSPQTRSYTQAQNHIWIHVAEDWLSSFCLKYRVIRTSRCSGLIVSGCN